MGTAQSREIILKFLEGMSSGNLDWDMVASDVKWWIQGLATLDKAAFQQVSSGIKALGSEPPQMFYDHITAEDDRVAVEARSRIPLRDGRVFENTYHFLFVVRDGLIVEVREHFDTAYARDFFGADAQAAMVGQT